MLFDYEENMDAILDAFGRLDVGEEGENEGENEGEKVDEDEEEWEGIVDDDMDEEEWEGFED